MESPSHHTWTPQARGEEQSSEQSAPGRFQALQKEAKEFVILHDLPVPTSDLEWKQLYREMGSFAVKVFINRTPQVVLDLPVADIHDSKNHLRFRAVCDERITLPLKAFRDFPEIYNTLSTSLGQEAVVEVKMAWRCNTEQWWTARLKPEYAGPIYRKLGYSESYIQGLGLGNRDTSAAFGAERIILNPSAPEQVSGVSGLKTFISRAARSVGPQVSMDSATGLRILARDSPSSCMRLLEALLGLVQGGLRREKFVSLMTASL